MAIRKKPNRKITFTKRALELLPPHDKTRQKGNGTEYSDTVCTGLHLIIGPTGRIHFIHRFTAPNGKKGAISLGEYLPGVVSIDDVRKTVYGQKAKLARGEDPREERRQTQEIPSFADFAREHYIPHAKEHKKTWQEDVWKIDCGFRAKPATDSAAKWATCSGANWARHSVVKWTTDCAAN